MTGRIINVLREAERELFLAALPCEAISKRKHRPYTGVERAMETKLERISHLSKANPEMVFTSVYHLINKELLTSCHNDMDGKKAVGIDGVTKEKYGEELESNIDNLVERLKNKSYVPKPARRVEIEKENGKKRPLSIYCYEDKLVQEAVRRVLEAIFEPHFYNEMMGFRPDRSCHKAIRLLNTMIERNYTNYILDADIKGFFDHLDHEWIIRFVESKVKDPNLIRLIRRMLKGGIMEDYVYEPTEEGSGQGSICSPILANIYMHYVLVWWIKERIAPKLQGFCGIVVYADDFVLCFQHKDEAEWVHAHLKSRMGHFGLELEENKTRLIEFGRFAEENAKRRSEKSDTFTFLGFTHYCSKSKNGKFRVKRKTSRKKFAKKCRELNKLIRDMRTLPLKEIFGKVNQILTGYYHYYGITDNIHSLGKMKDEIERLLFYWLNRRSQRSSYTWESFHDLKRQFPIVQPKIYVSVYG